MENDQWGNYAYLAGWNGEFKVKYTLDHDNSTIKGMFQRLDENLLYGPTRSLRTLRTRSISSGISVTALMLAGASRGSGCMSCMYLSLPVTKLTSPTMERITS